ncbi:hypothetical protein M3J09_006911 [Ascochyta lentis]
MKIRSCPEPCTFTTPRETPTSWGRSRPTASLKSYQYLETQCSSCIRGLPR